ncbi:transcription factor 21 [Anolis carolinensis]|uniref:Transcription factor 21 n=1 Tax=Anolis carolinensis TaxID=28377 RepID=H9GGA5_ANOCA|nr:PREDICTED: transcription factor 21 [Anolis carolinensis]|eukprot:XP_003223359.1 PREDICTED: transcription factor 21 [Anolis carolinensis]
MSTGSLSDAEGEMLACEEDEEEEEEATEPPAPALPAPAPAAPPGKAAGAGGKARRKASSGPGKRGSAHFGGAPEGKQVQRHAANARERARMRVLSKAFSRLKTTLPWVPPDTKLSKLDTLRLASSYIAHLRQILASDKYENGYSHPVNLTWPFMVAGKPENELKEAVNTARLCGPTAS